MMYTVCSGDNLSKIAAEHGFADWRTIYNDPNNAEFRRLRPNPNLIFPGDRLFIPDRGSRSAPAPTGSETRFRAHRGGGPFCPTDFEVAPASLTLGAEDSSVLRASDIQSTGPDAVTFTWRTTSTKLLFDGVTASPQAVSGPALTIRAGSEAATDEVVEVTRTQPTCAPISKQVHIAIVCERFPLARPRIIATALDSSMRPTTTFTDPALLGGHSLSFGDDLAFSIGRAQPFGPSVGATTAVLETRMRALLTELACLPQNSVLRGNSEARPTLSGFWPRFGQSSEIRPDAGHAAVRGSSAAPAVPL